MPPPGIEPATPCFLACPSNHSAIGRDIDMLLELLQYFLIKRYKYGGGLYDNRSALSKGIECI